MTENERRLTGIIETLLLSIRETRVMSRYRNLSFQVAQAEKAIKEIMSGGRHDPKTD